MDSDQNNEQTQRQRLADGAAPFHALSQHMVNDFSTQLRTLLQSSTPFCISIGICAIQFMRRSILLPSKPILIMSEGLVRAIRYTTTNRRPERLRYG